MVEVSRSLDQDFSDNSASEDGHSFVIINDPCPIPGNAETICSSNLETSMQALSLAFSSHSLGHTSRKADEVNDASIPTAISPHNEYSSLTITDLNNATPEEKDNLLVHLLHQKVNMEETMRQNNLGLKQYVGNLSKCIKVCEKVFQEHKERFQETRSFVLKLQAENSELHRICQELSENLQIEKSKRSESSLIAEVETFQSRYQSEVEKNNIITAQLFALKNEKKALLEKMEDLKTLELQVNHHEREENAGLVKQLYDLSAQLVETDTQLKNKSVEVERLKTMTDETVLRLRSRIDEMTAIIVANEDKISSLSSELKSIKDENSRLMMENEAISILKAQVDLYQSDYLIESRERDRLSRELFQLKDDFRQLHQLNQQLDPSSAQSLNTDQDVSGQRTAEGAPIPQNREFFCPICSLRFHRLALLEHHAQQCGSLD